MKWNLYADETIWATDPGFILTLVLVLPAHEREELSDVIIRVEALSGRQRRKWTNSLTHRKIQFLEGLPDILKAHHSVYWRIQERVHSDQVEVMTRILVDAASAIDRGATFNVMVDGFKSVELHRIKKAFRARSLQFKKVIGGRDESEPLLRLADALAGFLGDMHKGKPYAREAWTKHRAWFREI